MSKTEKERLSNLFKITHLNVVEPGFEPKSMAPFTEPLHYLVSEIRTKQMQKGEKKQNSTGT